MESNKLAFALGMAQKAGKTASGDVAVKGALKSGKTKLLVVAADCADSTKKELCFLAKQAGVQIVEGGTRAELGWAIGKAPRASIAILDNNFAKMLIK